MSNAALLGTGDLHAIFAGGVGPLNTGRCGPAHTGLVAHLPSAAPGAADDEWLGSKIDEHRVHLVDDGEVGTSRVDVAKAIDGDAGSQEVKGKALRCDQAGRIGLAKHKARERRAGERWVPTPTDLWRKRRLARTPPASPRWSCSP